MSKSNKVSQSSLSARLSNSRGRMVGVHTVTSRGEASYNGQIRSVTPNFVTLFDRNQKRQVKVALKTISVVTGV
jgi:ferredoxin-fold anticodon binding domain-containing protein